MNTSRGSKSRPTSVFRERAVVNVLSVNPQPPNCVALQGEDGVYRVRVGDYWIVYEVLDSVLHVKALPVAGGVAIASFMQFDSTTMEEADT